MTKSMHTNTCIEMPSNKKSTDRTLLQIILRKIELLIYFGIGKQHIENNCGLWCHFSIFLNLWIRMKKIICNSASTEHLRRRFFSSQKMFDGHRRKINFSIKCEYSGKSEERIEIFTILILGHEKLLCILSKKLNSFEILFHITDFRRHSLVPAISVYHFYRWNFPN